MIDYEAVIGLEIHAELMTASKMFCGCRVVDSVEAPPNSAVCPICLGMPGMLPVINRRAVEFALRVALALHCQIQEHNLFARKNYFYPDLPKAYQISQYELPLARHGWLDIELTDGAAKRIRIRRVHMEEDTGKLTHLERGGSRVDFNRSGVPLLEIVSEPDIGSGGEARTYAMKIRQILRYLQVNSGDMEKGVLRVEPNISLRPAGSDELGTRTELKNLNSFRSLAEGTDFEILRQRDILLSGGRVVQETRGWDEDKRLTYSQRAKEEADDYRYFAEPDLPPLQVSPTWVEELRVALPELPDARIERFQATYGLSAYEAGVLTEDQDVAQWFEAAVESGGAPKSVSNWIINELFRLLNESGKSLTGALIAPHDLAGLIALVEDQTLSNSSAKEVLETMFATGKKPAEIVAERGLAQISDEDALREVIAQVMSANEDQVAAYLGGKEKLKGWFVGQVMRETRGKANPALVNRLLAQQLAEAAKR